MTAATVMGPPPDRIPNDSSDLGQRSISAPGETSSASDVEAITDDATLPGRAKRPAVPYVIPEWSGPPCHKYSLEVLKDGAIIDNLAVSEKGAYMFGRVDLCDFILEHPTISRFHAVLQYKRNGNAYIYDTGSTHGTFVNKKQVDKQVHVELHVGDIVRFGQSSRLYIFHGPADLMPPETDRKMLKEAKIQQEFLDREASLRRARAEASRADGISWGMGEDAIEEIEDDTDEITWQTYKGTLTEKQEKTREKVLKRLEKIGHMKKEIDAIRVKDIPQGGLTQGQQTQIARNELRIAQLLEELESLEETLNDSIRESLGARRKTCRGRSNATAEEETYLSDENDDFYDRTKKTTKPRTNDSVVETADSLLDKRDAVIREMEDKKRLFAADKEDAKLGASTSGETMDSLDDFMREVSSELVLDKTARFEKELSSLQLELDRISLLLKMADPSGEASRRRESKPETAERGEAVSDDVKPEAVKTDKVAYTNKSEKSTCGDEESKRSAYTAAKPQWLGAKTEAKPDEDKPVEPPEVENSGGFVDYKDREKIIPKENDDVGNAESEIERAAPGLIIRKRKESDEAGGSSGRSDEHAEASSSADLMAEDAVALLLKHKRGYHDSDEEEEAAAIGEEEDDDNGLLSAKKLKRMLGPARPSFLGKGSEYESWLPPEGQSGDGRTSLNERFGY